MNKLCPFLIELPVPRRTRNALNVEVGTPLPRCKLKIPENWVNARVTAERWLFSGGDALILGVCSRDCPNKI